VQTVKEKEKKKKRKKGKKPSPIPVQCRSTNILDDLNTTTNTNIRPHTLVIP